PAAGGAVRAAVVALGGAGAVLLAALAAGRLLAGLARKPDPLVALAAGLVPLGLLAQGLGLLGLLQPAVLHGLLLVLIAGGGRLPGRAPRRTPGTPAIPRAACAAAAGLV